MEMPKAMLNMWDITRVHVNILREMLNMLEIVRGPKIAL